MASFGKASEEKLKHLHPDLIRIVRKAIKTLDFTIVQTIRTEEQHNDYLARGMTTIPYNKTRHKPNDAGLSEAMDLAPWPINWEDENKFYFLAGVILQCAKEENIAIRCGYDWDGDGDFKDQNFNDIPHTELKVRLI